MGIKTAENFEKIGGAEGKADAGDIFLDEFCVLMPMTSPWALSSGPPLFPGLMGVSV